MFEFLHSYTFVLKNKLVNTNKEDNALSQRFMLLRINTMKSTRLESMKANYDINKNFPNVGKELKETWSGEINPYLHRAI